MPKLSVDFPATLSISTTDEDKILLIAIGYMMGSGGEYNQPARNFIRRGIESFVEKLDARDRKKFDEILGNVRIMHTKRLPGEEKQKSPIA